MKALYRLLVRLWQVLPLEPHPLQPWHGATNKPKDGK